jgi:hypothetical protein
LSSRTSDFSKAFDVGDDPVDLVARFEEHLNFLVVLQIGKIRVRFFEEVHPDRSYRFTRYFFGPALLRIVGFSEYLEHFGFTETQRQV